MSSTWETRTYVVHIRQICFSTATYISLNISDIDLAFYIHKFEIQIVSKYNKNLMINVICFKFSDYKIVYNIPTIQARKSTDFLRNVPRAKPKGHFKENLYSPELG